MRIILCILYLIVHRNIQYLFILCILQLIIHRNILCLFILCILYTIINIITLRLFILFILYLYDTYSFFILRIEFHFAHTKTKLLIPKLPAPHRRFGRPDLHNIRTVTLHPAEIKPRLQYKNKSLKSVQGNNRCLFRETHKTHDTHCAVNGYD
jgi:hypothetical protein